MSTYDTVVAGDREGQVKCWFCDMAIYSVGCWVPSVNGAVTYSVAMREGGFINVIKNILESWTEKPRCEPVFDKWGNPWKTTCDTCKVQDRRTEAYHGLPATWFTLILMSEEPESSRIVASFQLCPRCTREIMRVIDGIKKNAISSTH